jgi:hypothetical protein
LQAIAEIYAALARHRMDLSDEDEAIVVAYYLHNLYCAFESIFQRIAEVFGNQVSERSGWHAALLRRMTLDIHDLRPRVIRDSTHDCLDELRRFRHLFRGGYRLHLDLERLALVRARAARLQDLYRADIGQFMAFLDDLLSD